MRRRLEVEQLQGDGGADESSAMARDGLDAVEVRSAGPWASTRQFVAEARGSEYKPWESLVGQIYLGGETFCDMVQSIISSQPRSREYPRAQRELVRPTLDHLIELILEEFDESPESLRRKNHRPGRKAFASLAVSECGLTHRMIAQYLDVSEPAVSKMIHSSARIEQSDRGYRACLRRIRGALS